MRLIPISYAEADDLAAPRARNSSLRAGRSRLTTARTRSSPATSRANLNSIEELIRSLDTQTPAGAHRGAHRRGHEQLHARRRHPVGRRHHVQRGHGQPHGPRLPLAVSVVRRRDDAARPTAGLSPFSSTVSNPNFAVNLPAAVGTGSGGALGITLGSINNIFNLNLRLSAAETSGLVRIVSSPRILTLTTRRRASARAR